MIQVVLHQQYEHLQAFVSGLPANFANEGKIIYNARNQIRVFTLSDGVQLNVKRFVKPHIFNRLIYSFFRLPKATRAYLFGLKLLAEKVPTPQPIAYLLEKRNGLLSTSYLVTAQSPLTRNFYEFGEGDIFFREHIIRAFARFAATLHNKGIYHKDFSPGNILFDVKQNEVYFALVDINRMYFGKVSFKKACQNFARLWGPRSFFEILADEYAKVRGYDVMKCTQLILRYRNRFWRGRQHSFNL